MTLRDLKSTAVAPFIEIAQTALTAATEIVSTLSRFCIRMSFSDGVSGFGVPKRAGRTFKFALGGRRSLNRGNGVWGSVAGRLTVSGEATPRKRPWCAASNARTYCPVWKSP